MWGACRSGWGGCWGGGATAAWGVGGRGGRRRRGASGGEQVGALLGVGVGALEAQDASGVEGRGVGVEGWIRCRERAGRGPARPSWGSRRGPVDPLFLGVSAPAGEAVIHRFLWLVDHASWDSVVVELGMVLCSWACFGARGAPRRKISQGCDQALCGFFRGIGASELRAGTGPTRPCPAHPDHVGGRRHQHRDNREDGKAGLRARRSKSAPRLWPGR